MNIKLLMTWFSGEEAGWRMARIRLGTGGERLCLHPESRPQFHYGAEAFPILKKLLVKFISAIQFREFAARFGNTATPASIHGS